MKKPKPWRIPRRLPPCWWVAVHQRDGSLQLNGPHDSREEAESDWIHEKTDEWVNPPLRLEVVAENPDVFLPKSGTGAIGSLAKITARWNWFRRHRRDLVRWTGPRSCLCLVPQQGEPKDLLSHRLGGPAVLPRGHPWPTFQIENGFHPSGRRRRKKTVQATFAATLDLRGRFSFGKEFPAAISLFFCTYCDFRQSYNIYSGSPDVPEGIVVPLFAKDRLVKVDVPPPGVQLDCLAAAPYEMPDFPPQHVDLSEVVHAVAPTPETEQIYREIESREPGTSAWININGLKIGGYESYIQQSVRAIMAKKHPTLDWHYIATWCDDRIMLGDAGEMYVVAGHDKASRNWQWYCTWDCF